MDRKDLKFIEDQIGYTFKNKDLLRQAFVRRSYSEENGGENNEVLEFIGDKVLDIVVVKFLTDRFGYFVSDCDNFNSEKDFNEFACEHNEGKLTSFKVGLVRKRMLAHRIDLFGFSDYLIMGKGDIANQVEKQSSVKEDLFEAIIGAVTLDAEWNFEEIKSVIDILLAPEDELSNKNEMNYVQLIQEWTLKNQSTIPWYRFKEASYQKSWYYPFDGIKQGFNVVGEQKQNEVKFWCFLKISDTLPPFLGFGKSKAEARQNVCELAYNHLKNNDLLSTINSEIENPNQEDAINQLEILARRGYFSIPTYNFCQEHDQNGNPIWTAECHITEYEIYFSSKSSSKKQAKKESAYKMLLYILDGEKNDQIHAFTNNPKECLEKASERIEATLGSLSEVIETLKSGIPFDDIALLASENKD